MRYSVRRLSCCDWQACDCRGIPTGFERAVTIEPRSICSSPVCTATVAGLHDIGQLPRVLIELADDRSASSSLPAAFSLRRR